MEIKQTSINENIDEILSTPQGLMPEEQTEWSNFSKIIKANIRYKLMEQDKELIRQYCQLKVIRDNAWRKYMENPERYMRIVTGICNDGVTPKIVVKENEHYKTLIESNKHLEKLLADLRLTPLARKIR
ncbi:hypothetical protein [Chryseobacterium sp.]|uniref:hypothetical protein n=1 Tax=Chryseobacterium sp. TaxID=1871047 RepID=UPI002FCBAE42